MLGKPQGRAFDITDRQLQILELLAQGLTYAAIAAEIGGSGRTIEKHIASLLKKMGATNRAHAVALAAGLGMVGIVEPLRANNG